MSSKKLGRNPLDKMDDLPVRKILTVPRGRIAEAPRQMGSLEKIKEMQIRVDWPEFYDSAIGSRLRRISKLFSV